MGGGWSDSGGVEGAVLYADVYWIQLGNVRNDSGAGGRMGGNGAVPCRWTQWGLRSAGSSQVQVFPWLTGGATHGRRGCSWRPWDLEGSPLVQTCYGRTSLKWECWESTLRMNFYAFILVLKYLTFSRAVFFLSMTFTAFCLLGIPLVMHNIFLIGRY